MFSTIELKENFYMSFIFKILSCIRKTINDNKKNKIIFYRVIKLQISFKWEPKRDQTHLCPTVADCRQLNFQVV